LSEDPAGSGLRTGFGRGNLSSTNDTDYYSFTARAGDQLIIGTDVPGEPGASQLHYAVIDPAGNVIYDFYPSYNGYGQSSPLLLGAGNYRLRVTYNYDYEGEYRFRITLAPPALQAEGEDNSSIGHANPVLFTTVGTGKVASV